MTDQKLNRLYKLFHSQPPLSYLNLNRSIIFFSLYLKLKTSQKCFPSNVGREIKDENRWMSVGLPLGIMPVIMGFPLSLKHFFRKCLSIWNVLERNCLPWQLFIFCFKVLFLDIYLELERNRVHFPFQMYEIKFKKWIWLY